MTSSLDDGDDAAASVRKLQQQAYELLLKRIGTEQGKENENEGGKGE